MKASEVRALSGDELDQKIKDQREQLFNARVKHATGQLENTAQISALRREVARLETVLAERREEK
jgi:large subunit ribosomal protein L29